MRMNVTLPPGMDPDERATLLAIERAYCQELQREGKWLHIWRVSGHYANISVFDVADNDQLHDLLWGLPLFPYMTMEIIPLNAHPSDIAADCVAAHAGGTSRCSGAGNRCLSVCAREYSPYAICPTFRSPG
ncbi:MAG: muconolactone Delta-isomerase [Trebonia sp.]